ncbi:MAG: DUF3795 domain-containing protein [Desulfurivibrionaceae bacterium]
MEINPEHISPCGLYCGICGIYRATQENNLRFLKVILKKYQTIIPNSEHFTAEDLLCDGCYSKRRSFTCNSCAIRDCAEKKQNNGCHKCSGFPCEHVNDFPIETGKKVIFRAIPYRKEHGTAKWIMEEEKRYICPACDNKLFRGVTQCNKCKEPVDLD